MSVTVRAPVRICDLGGWTDTWFGGPGRVLNLAVEPGVVVTLAEADGPPGRIRIELESFGHSYEIIPGESRPARHPFVEAAVDMCPPDPAAAYTMTIRSDVPPGSGTGTSAAVTVAVIAALAQQMLPQAVAYAAHRIESEVLGGESGIQDQFASALGGINFLRIDKYPSVQAERLPPWPGLDELVSLVYLGRAHRSSAVHEEVIAGAGAARRRALDLLRDAAGAGRRAVLDQDVDALGRALLANSEGQSLLHPSLIGSDARRVLPLISATEAAGWKVNGAGGEGGSLTVLHRRPRDKEAFAAGLAAVSPDYRTIPVRLCPAGAAG